MESETINIIIFMGSKVSFVFAILAHLLFLWLFLLMPIPFKPEIKQFLFIYSTGWILFLIFITFWESFSKRHTKHR
jgi:hypothetical protein